MVAVDDAARVERLFLADSPPGPRDRRFALGAVAISFVVFVAIAPFAKLQLPQVWAFIPSYQSALVINDLITAVLLFGQYRILRSRALLVLASGYLFTASIAVVHALTFPGVFAPTGLLGAGPQTTAWLYMFWHSGFPLFVVAYALLKGERRDPGPRNRNEGASIVSSVGLVLMLVLGIALFVVLGQGLLPAVILGTHYTSAMLGVISSVWALSFLALAVLWRRRPYSVLDLWLMVVMCAWIFDIALGAVLNNGRFDLGFYAGRVYGLMAASFVLIMLLSENGILYARLAASFDAERRERRRAEQQGLELAAVNQELEAFSYSVAHDLRAPLRGVDGFSQALLEDYADKLDDEGRLHLRYVRESAQQMAALIDDLLALSRVTRGEMLRERVNLSDTAAAVIDRLRRADPGRDVAVAVARDMVAAADARLVTVALENLLGNAWKFTGKQAEATIEFGVAPGSGAVPANGRTTYFVRDNGAGFDMAHAGKLFGVFQRLHSTTEFDGTGIGLATVQRVVRRHGGRVWAEAEVGRGATFYFTLGESPVEGALP
jgi:signal transduction histidine kinase